MNIIWIVLAVVSFLGGQLWLFFCLGKLDKSLERRPKYTPNFTYDDSCRYPDEDVIQ